MEFLLKQIEALVERLRQVVVEKNSQTIAGQKLWEKALTFLGKDASPADHATDEYGCAESVNAIHEAAFGEPLGGDVSTYRMYHALKNHKKFVRVNWPLPGDIIISPTGYGGTPQITNGHVGIVDKNHKVMSNNSRTGKWERNFDLFSWEYRYKTLGKFPIYYYRKII